MLMRGRGCRLILTRKIEGRGVKRIIENREFHLSRIYSVFFVRVSSIAYIGKKL